MLMFFAVALLPIAFLITYYVIQDSSPGPDDGIVTLAIMATIVVGFTITLPMLLIGSFFAFLRKVDESGSSEEL